MLISTSWSIMKTFFVSLAFYLDCLFFFNLCGKHNLEVMLVLHNRAQRIFSTMFKLNMDEN